MHKPEPKVVRTDLTHRGMIVFFEDGVILPFPTALLHAFRRLALIMIEGPEELTT
jgi:hypothetical protein